jgi:hypothetical protein
MKGSKRWKKQTRRLWKFIRGKRIVGMETWVTPGHDRLTGLDLKFEDGSRLDLMVIAWVNDKPASLVWVLMTAKQVRQEEKAAHA